jgi:hypothetical protein
MKRINHHVAFLFTMLIVVVLIIAGCGSTGIQRSERTTSTMQAMDDEIKLVVVQLDATGASLDELMKPGQSDVKKAFELYSSNVSKIEKMEKNFSKHAKEMKDRGAEYFDEWQKQGEKYENPKIQELSEQRRAELGEIYGKIAENSIGMNEVFKAYVSDVKEIQMYISNDLTSRGIESIAPISRQAVTDGNRLKNAIKKLQTSIEEARSAMAHSGQ